jgi:uncharacterized protein
MKFASSFLVGLVFGFGLLVSGMNDPQKVLGFLDLAGHWDPSLAFVMGGAVIVAFIGFRVAAGRAASLSGEAVQLPRETVIDRKLVGGALIFGIGWGMVGLCPGPAITDIGFLDWHAIVFVAAMAAGMLLQFAVSVGRWRWQSRLNVAVQDG